MVTGHPGDGSNQMSIASVVPTTIPNFSNVGTPLPITQGGTAGITYQGGGSSSLVTQSGLSLSTFFGIFIDLFAVLAVLSVVGIFVIIVVANRADPDPSGRRPQSVLYFAVSFVTLATTVLGSAVVVAGVVVLVGNHSHSVSNPAARAIVFGGLVTLISAFLLSVHLRRGLALARADGEFHGPSQRVGQSYVSAVAFVSVLSILVLGVFSVYLIFALAGPGVFGSLGGTADTVRVLIVSAYLLVAAETVLWTHRKIVKPGLDLFGGGAELAPAQPGTVAGS
jgi:hypothetical protein